MHIYLMVATLNKAGDRAGQLTNGLKFHIQLFQLNQALLSGPKAWQASLCGVNKKLTD